MLTFSFLSSPTFSNLLERCNVGNILGSARNLFKFNKVFYGNNWYGNAAGHYCDSVRYYYIIVHRFLNKHVNQINCSFRMKKAEDLHVFFVNPGCPGFSIDKLLRLYRHLRSVSKLIHDINELTEITLFKMNHEIKVCRQPDNSMKDKGHTSNDNIVNTAHV